MSAGTWDSYVPFGDGQHAGLTSARSSNNGKPSHVGADAERGDIGDDGKGNKQGGVVNKGSTRETPSQARAFWAMAMPYFRESSRGRWLFFILVCLMILNSTVRVIFSYLARDFWSALANQNEEEFYRIIRNFLIALVALAPINVFYRFQRQRLAIQWREWMTDRVLELYYSNQVYYALERSYSKKTASASSNGSGNMNGTSNIDADDDGRDRSQLHAIDNPDQRISEDVKNFTQFSLSLFLIIAVSTIDLVAFSTILFTIEPNLFFSIIAFATVGTLLTIIIGGRLIRQNFVRLQREADFRYSLVRIRDHAESIAFFGGERIEGRQIKHRFDRVIENAKEIIGTQRNLDFFTTLYAYLTWILPIIVVAPDYFAGEVEMGVIQQAAAAFGHVLEDLSIIITEFESLSEFSAAIDRLNQFLAAIRDADADRDNEGCPLMMKGTPPTATAMSVQTSSMSKEMTAKMGFQSLSSSQPMKQMITIRRIQSILERKRPSSTTQSTTQSILQPNIALSIRNFTLLTPSSNPRTLIRNLNAELPWGRRLLIMGPSGVGKSSLLRAIAGLWTSGSGTIIRPSCDEIYFLPQKPYCPLGTLREQLLYPHFGWDDSDERGDNLDAPMTTATAANATGIPSMGNEKNASNKVNVEMTTLQRSVDPTRTIPTDDDLLQILKDIDLYHVARQIGNGKDNAILDAEVDWGNTLSLGEQQRLAFGRVLVSRPRLVILDESTSAMDVERETKMYALLKDLRSRRRGSAEEERVTYVSVGHRPTLLSHHDAKLEIKGVDAHGLSLIETSGNDVAHNELKAFISYA